MSEGFSADWLALREPADAAARSLSLTRTLTAALTARHPIRVLDLGAGTGSNLRYLSPSLSDGQRWLLVDRAPDLLAEAQRRAHADASSPQVEVRTVDLATLSAVPELFECRDLVTASALLDLVSADWLQSLAGRCRAADAAVLVALTYDGRVRCTPADHTDERVRMLVNRHQQSDKGFGVALGPDATAAAAGYFTRAGYSVRVEASDWQLTPDQRALQTALIAGWADAAIAMAPAEIAEIDEWRARRIAHVTAGRSFVTVGHQDLLGVPSVLTAEIAEAADTLFR